MKSPSLAWVCSDSTVIPWLNLQHMEEAKDEDFRPQFLEELHQLLELVHTSARPKKLYHEALNGASRLVFFGFSVFQRQN